MFEDLKKLRKKDVYGFEYLTDWILLLLRRISLSYWIRRPFERPLKPKCRTRVIDLYCWLQLVGLSALLLGSSHRYIRTALSVYILFEVYLSLFNIIFIGKFRDINYKPQSIERVILLMFLNVLQVVFAFAVLYRAPGPHVR
jgi:hypothetical protein